MSEDESPKPFIKKPNTELLAQLGSGFPGSAEDELKDRYTEVTLPFAKPDILNDPNLPEKLNSLKNDNPDLYKEYLKSLRSDRLYASKKLKDSWTPFSFLSDHPLDTEVESHRIEELRKIVLNNTELTEEQTDELRKIFPSGNFLYHGSDLDGCVKILDSGEIASTATLKGRNHDIQSKAGEDCGIAWNFNKVGVLPGDPYHISGFLTSPESVLRSSKTKLIVPWRPGENELELIPSNFDYKKYTHATTQQEIMVGAYFQAAEFKRYQIEGEEMHDTIFTSPDLSLSQNLTAVREGVLTVDELRKFYEIKDDGVIEFDPDIITDGRGLSSIVALQAYLDNPLMKTPRFTDRLQIKGEDITQLTDKEVFDILDAGIRGLSFDYRQGLMKELEDLQAGTDDITVGIENTIFVAPENDLEQWLKILARTGKSPKFILPFHPATGPRIPKWKEFYGDQDKMTEVLSSFVDTVVPEKKVIPWEEIVGQPINGESHGTGGYRYVMKHSFIKDSNEITLDESSGQLKVA